MGNILAFILALGFLALLFWVTRSIILWYFKIDQIADDLSAIRKILQNKLK